MAALTDDFSGASLGLRDAYENMLLTGASLWMDQATDATIHDTDNDENGLVVRHSSNDQYYSCGSTTDASRSCLGRAAVATCTVLQKVDGTIADLGLDSAPYDTDLNGTLQQQTWRPPCRSVAPADRANRRAATSP